MQNNQIIKIGILIKELKKLRNFELRILDNIIQDPQIELKVLIFDGRKKDKGLLQKILKEIKSGTLFSKIIQKVQEKIETKLFKVSDKLDKDSILKKLNEIPNVSMSPNRKGFSDIFDIEDCKKIREYELDVLIRQEFNIIKGQILNEPKFGIWSFHHADNSKNRGGPSCFWEVYNKEKYVGVTLQKLTPELDGGEIIEKAYYNVEWSWIKTRNIVQESSVNILFKSLNKLKNGKFNTKKSSLYFYPLYKSPVFFIFLKYIVNFYIRLFNKIIIRISSSIFSIRYSHWAIVISKGQFIHSVLHRLRPIKSPLNQFWADPFLIKNNNEHYVFFENYEYNKKKGKISCGKIVEDKLVNIVDVLEKPYHLSYPNVFYYGDNIFMIPETHENKRLEVYKCISFPEKWELYSTAFNGERIADCNFFVDKDNNKWLLLNKHEPSSVLHSDLYIYQVDSLKLNKVIPHNENPVLIDTRKARNAGPLFKHNDRVYRPSQINIEGIYGRGININEIEKLTLDEYKEKVVQKCYPFFKKNLVGTHHIHQYDNTFVFDVCYKTRIL